MEGTIREAIHGLKYRNLRAAAPTLGQLLAQWLESTSIPGEIIVAVPLHRRRLRDRGYNQSVLLAKEVGKRTGLPVMEEVLVRTRDTPPRFLCHVRSGYGTWKGALPAGVTSRAAGSSWWTMW